MIKIYTTNSCSSCKKAVQWLKDNNIPFEEKNIFNKKITKEDIREILSHSENGFEDIISTRSKVFTQKKLNIDDMKFSELENLILENPSILKRPIIIDDGKFQVGYNDDDISMFVPKNLRKMFTCDLCGKDMGTCEYVKELEEQLKNDKN